jgi:N-acetylglucosamine-6-phosphate deacetylase
MSTLIANCHVISPDLDVPNASVLVDGDTIAGVFAAGEKAPAADSVFDAAGAMLMPGFIDIHYHGAVGHDNTDGSVEAVERIAEAKLRDGVTTVCPTTLTLPEEQLAASLRAVAEYAANPSFAKVAGVHLEGPYINCQCTGAQNPAYVRPPDIEEVKRLNAICKVAIVTFAVEVEGGIEFAKQLADEGIVASCGHTAATYEQLAAAKAAGLTHLTHFCNQMTKLHHREIGCVGGGLLDDELIIEMICDKIHLSPDMIRLAFKVKPAETIALITDSMSATGLEDGDYSLGGLAVVVKEGAARLKSDGALAGSTLQINRALKNVYEVTGLPLSRLVQTTSLNQATSLGLAGLGKVEAGYTADLALLDSDFNVTAAFVDGQRKI